MVTAWAAVLAFLLVTASAACAITAPLGSLAVRGLDVSAYQHAGRPVLAGSALARGLRHGAPGVPSPWQKWTFWQYADDSMLPGAGLVDVDFCQATPALPALRHTARSRRSRQATKLVSKQQFSHRAHHRR